VPFLRYLWSLCQQAVTSRSASFSLNNTERRFSDCFEKSVIFKLISDGKLVSVNDMLRLELSEYYI